MSYNKTPEQLIEARENAVDTEENHLWILNNKNPISLIEALIEWSRKDLFCELEADDLGNRLDDICISLSVRVNPFLQGSWDSYFIQLIKDGRTAKLVSEVLLAIEKYGSIFDKFNELRAELEISKSDY